MGKTYRKDAKNAQWRREKHNRDNKKQRLFTTVLVETADEMNQRTKSGPYFEIGGDNDIAYGT